MNEYKTVVGKPEGKELLVRPRRRWEIIKIYFKEILWGCKRNCSGSAKGPMTDLCVRASESPGTRFRRKQEI